MADKEKSLVEILLDEEDMSDVVLFDNDDHLLHLIVCYIVFDKIKNPAGNLISAGLGKILCRIYQNRFKTATTDPPRLLK